MIFKLGRKLIFEQNYTFFIIIWDIFAIYNQILQLESCFVLLIVLHSQTRTLLIPLSVNFGLPRENLATSTILRCN